MTNSADESKDQVTLTLDRSTAAAVMQTIATQGLGASQATGGKTPQWRALPNAPVASSRTDDIWFYDENIGWLVNSNGEVCRTNDGGTTWTRQTFVSPTHPAKPYLRTIHFAGKSKNVGWFGALCGTSKSYLDVLLHQTANGGKSWTPVANLPSGSPQGICGISVVDENVMYGVGSNDPSRIGPALIKTTDGGKSWTSINMKPWADNLIDIQFMDARRGYVVGGKKAATAFCPGNQPWYKSHPQYAQLRPVVLYTEDGGESWVNQVAGMTTSFDCGSWGWKMFWLDDQRGFISIEDFAHGVILSTTNGGNPDDGPEGEVWGWVMRPVNDQRNVYSKSSKGGKGSKGGKAKTIKSVVGNANLEGIGFIDDQTGWVGGWGDSKFIGDYNSVTRNGGRNWTAQDHIPSDPNSDPRRNVNRYRFVGTSRVGYCSGQTVYKLFNKSSGDAKSATLATLGKSAAPATFLPSIPSASSLALAVRPGDNKGEVEISFDIPPGTARAYVGIWNHFGWHVCTLLDETKPAAGSRSITWSSPDIGTTFLCRLTCDDQGASESFQVG